MLLEIQDHDTGSKAIFTCDNKQHAARVLKEKGYTRLMDELCWAGYDKRGHEISIMEPCQFQTIDSVISVTQEKA